MAKFKTKVITFICNILISVLSLVSVGSYFVLPLWRIDASYHIEEQTLEKMLEDMLEENASENEALKDLDVSEIVDAEGLTIPLSLSLETRDVLSALGQNGAQMAQNIIDNMVNTVVDQFSGTLNKLAKALTKSVTKNALQSAMNEQIYSTFVDEKTAEEVEELLSGAGIDDTYITEKTDELVETIFSENATVSGVSQNVTVIVEEVFDKLATSGNEEFKDIELSEEDKAEIEATVSEVLSSIANEDGTIDIDGLIAEGLLAILGGDTSSGGDIPDNSGDALPEDSTMPTAKLLNASYDNQTSDSAQDSTQDSAENGTSVENGVGAGDSAELPSEDTDEAEKDAQEELKAMLREKVMELLPENITQKIASVLKIVSYVLLFTFFTWLYLILKILIKLGALNNSIRLKLPISLGWLPFLVLYVLPTGVFAMMKNPPTFVQNLLGAETIGSLSKISNGLNISFSSGAWVSFAVAVFLVLFNAIFYKKLRKSLKAVTKGEIARVDTPAIEPAPVIEPTKPVVEPTPVVEESKQTAATESADTATEESVDDGDGIEEADNVDEDSDSENDDESDNGDVSEDGNNDTAEENEEEAIKNSDEETDAE